MTDDTRAIDFATSGDYEIRTAEAQTAPPSPLSVARRLLRGRMLLAFGLATVLGLGGAYAGYSVPVPEYRSIGLIEVVPKIQRVLYTTEENSLMPMFEGFVDSQAALAQSRRVVDLAMADERWIALGRGNSHAEVARFLRSLDVKRQPRVQYVEIAFVDPDPGTAKIAVDCMMTAYLKLVEERDLQGGVKRLEKLEAKRTNLRADINELRMQELVVSDNYGPDALGARYSALTLEQGNLESASLQVDMELQTLSTSDGGSLDRRATMSLLEVSLVDAAVAARLGDKKTAEHAIRALKIVRGLGSSHKEVVAAEANLSDADKALTAALRRFREAPMAASNRETKIADAELRRSGIAKMREGIREELKLLAGKLTQLARLKEEQRALNEDLSRVRYRLEQLNVESSEVGGRIRLAVEAEYPVAPDRDRRRPMAILGLIGGGSLGIGFVLLLGLLTGRMRHLDDIGTSTSEGHFLAIVPEVGPDGQTVTQAAMSDFCIHQIRTLLQLRTHDEGRVVALTSPSPGAGKTTVGLALGLSFGSTGARTLLVDCDLVGHGLTSVVPSLVCQGGAAVLDACASFDTLDTEAVAADQRTHIARAFASRRTPTTDDDIHDLLLRVRDASDDGSTRARSAFRALEAVAKYRGVNGFAPGRRAGVLDVLDGASLSDCILESGFENLSVLPVGEATAGNAERLSPAHLRNLIATCREEYDTIILDTGPVLGSLEAAVVSSMADDVLFVVSRGQPRRLADQALDRLGELGASIAGIIFNRAAPADVVRSSYASSRSVPIGERA